MWVLFENLLRKFKFHWNRTTIATCLHEDMLTFLLISRSVFFRITNILDRSCAKFKTNILRSVTLCASRAPLLIMWKTVEASRPQITIWRMCIACWIPKATNTLLEYVMYVTFLLQQWLNERTSVSPYTYITWLFNLITKNLIKFAAQTVQHFIINYFPLSISLSLTLDILHHVYADRN